MSKIKKEQCPSCGGSLIDDSEKQMYRCTSCGSSYDYDYFREEQLHEMGETYLSRGECSAAIDAYKLILEKKPHDFLALRGLMLAAAFLKDMDGLSRIGEARHFSYDSKLADEVIEGASEEDKEYFTEFGKIYVNKQELIDQTGRSNLCAVSVRVKKLISGWSIIAVTNTILKPSTENLILYWCSLRFGVLLPYGVGLVCAVYFLTSTMQKWQQYLLFPADCRFLSVHVLISFISIPR